MTDPQKKKKKKNKFVYKFSGVNRFCFTTALCPDRRALPVHS